MITAALGVALAGWIFWENRALECNEYSVSCRNLPQSFEGFRIAQVSDFHNVEYGKGNKKLLELLRQAKPDIIVFTGDIIDSRRLKISVAISLMEEAAKIAPCYFATGNHESRISELQELLEGLEKAGAVVLRNEAVQLARGEDALWILGVDDPAFHADYEDGRISPGFMEAVVEWGKKEHGYTVLLSHRPEWFALYRDCGIDLVFSGHAHGGQFRIPFAGGFYGPNQGFFPKYDAGVFSESGTNMVVSRGAGPSIIPLRIHNPPEILVAELHRQEEIQ